MLGLRGFLMFRHPVEYRTLRNWYRILGKSAWNPQLILLLQTYPQSNDMMIPDSQGKLGMPGRLLSVSK